MHKETLLHRQVHPAFIVQNKVSSKAFELADDLILDNQVFIPTTKDDRKLSVCNGDKLTSEESYLHHTKKLLLKSAGTASVTIEECDAILLNTIEDNDPFPGHAYIDFSGLEKKDIRIKASVLKNHAIRRGFSPYEDS
jgi:hypothetical protein